MQIKEINYGVAFCITEGKDKWIEVNKNLKKYPYLYSKVMEHEIEHFNSINSNIDFLIDLKDLFNINKQLMLIGFTIKHPMAIMSNSPIFFKNKKVTFNYFALWFHIGIIVIVILLVLLVYLLLMSKFSLI